MLLAVLTYPIALAALAGRAYWRRPAIGVVVAIALLATPVTGGANQSASFHVAPVDLGLVLLIGVLALRVLAGRENGRLRPRTVVPFVLIVLSLACSTFTALDPASSFIGVIRYSQIFVLSPLAVGLAIKDRRDVRLVIGALAVLGIGEGIIGTIQFLTGTGAGYDGGSSRAVGTFGAYDIMGMATTVGIAMVICTAAAMVWEGRRRWIAAGTAVALAIPLACSLSRGAWLATAGGVLAATALRSWKRALLLVAGSGVVLAVVVGASGGHGLIGQRFSSLVGSTSGTPDQSVLDRYALWSSAEKMFVTHPVSGVGIKNFPLYRDTYAPVDLSSGSDIVSTSGQYQRVELLSPHSLYLLVLSEQGALGALAMITAAGAAAIGTAGRLYATARHRAQVPPEIQIGGLVAGALLVRFLLDVIYSDIGAASTSLISITLGVTFWWAAGLTGLREPATEPDTGARPRTGDLALLRPASFVPLAAGLPRAMVRMRPRRPQLPALRRAAAARRAALAETVSTETVSTETLLTEPVLTEPVLTETVITEALVTEAGATDEMAAEAITTGAVASAAGRRRRSRRAERLTGAALLVVGISATGMALGLLRDLVIARYFGASGQTDSFLVAWTIPETAVPLLVDGALAYLLIPMFSRALIDSGSLRGVVSGTAVPVLAVLAGLTALIAVSAPVFVHAVAPGLADPHLAVSGVRYAAVTVLCLGLAGYLMAALRASNVFGPPAGLNVAYNIGILTCIALLHRQLGVRSAALGLAVGAALALVVQLIAYVWHLGIPRISWTIDRVLLRAMGAFFPVAVYTLGRQAQVYVERFLGSSLDPGSISQLNYAVKVGQLPMLLTTTAIMVSFPALVRDSARGNPGRLSAAIVRNLRVVSLFVLPATAFLIAFAPEVVQLLFQRGAFSSADTSATAAILRVYVLGILGQSLVTVAVLPFFSGDGRAVSFPGKVALGGLAIVTLLDVAARPFIGTRGLAMGNAVGITIMAALLLRGVTRRVVRLDLPGWLRHSARCAVAAAGAGALARLAVGVLPVPGSVAATLLAGGIVLLAGYTVLTRLAGVSEVRTGLRQIAARLRALGGTA